MFIVISCEKNSITSETCGKNTINVNTSFGNFCPAFAELGGVDNCNNVLTFHYIFFDDNSTNTLLSFNFKINSNSTGTYDAKDSRISFSKNNLIPLEIRDKYLVPNKTKVTITESNSRYVSGFYEIDINGKDIVKGSFNKLKIVSWSKDMGTCK